MVDKKEIFGKIKQYGMLLIQLYIIITLYQYFGPKGLLYFALAIALVLLIRGWKFRKLYIYNLEKMETVIWGKPLDRKNWKKGELKNTKVKINWRKKKGDKKDGEG